MNEQNDRLDDILLTPEDSLRECLSVIHKHGVKNVFIVDSDTRLLGVVTENEIRGVLVNGASPDASVHDLVRDPTTVVTPTYSRAAVLDLMRMLHIGEVPVVDHEGRLVGIHRDRRAVGELSRDNWAVIMAGGRGTRLAPITENIPKPMLQIAGRPILERLVLHLVGAGIERIFLSVNYLGHLIQDHFGDGSAFGCSIEYLCEDEDRPLGTGGPLGLLWGFGYRPSAPLLVMNGDLVTGFAVGELLDAHATQHVVATIAVTEYQHQVPYGVLEGDEHRLVRIVEKPMPTWPVSSGIYVIEPELLPRVPHKELYPITNLFEDSLKRDESIGLWPMKDPWVDVGQPSDLARARGQL